VQNAQLFFPTKILLNALFLQQAASGSLFVHNRYIAWNNLGYYRHKDHQMAWYRGLGSIS
jgi:hypothetical protein